MQQLYESVVTPEQIDHLGHMNVRYYGAHARAGATELLRSIGLEPSVDRIVAQRDSYVRHHQEQLVGAQLVVRGSFHVASDQRVAVYEELANASTGELAATFVQAFELVDRVTREALTIAEDVVQRASDLIEVIPEHGRPRTLSFEEDVTATAPTLDIARTLDLAVREVRSIEPHECDEDGFVDALSVPELIWGGVPRPGREFRPLEDLADGGQMGMAIMESRSSYVRPVRVGDQVQSFSAQLAVFNKAAVSRNWLIDVDRGDLVAVFSVVNIAFDTGARRAIVIPDDVRRRFESRLHPELGGLGLPRESKPH